MKQLYLFLALCLLCFATQSLAQVNYTFGWTTGPVTITPGGSSFTWTTTTANDEEYSNAVNIFAGGENFNFAGTNFTQFQVSTNGFIRLGTGLAAATPTDALSGTLRSIIAPLWDDLSVLTTATDITYAITGTTPNQVLTVTWTNVKWNRTAPSTNAEFMVRLYETTNVIQFVYGTMGTPTAGSASIGLADNTVITTAGSATGKFLSINVGGTAGSRTYHQSMCFAFNAILNAPDAGTTMTFTPVTPSPLAAGAYTIGGTSPNYQTLSEAASALNIHGIAGPVVFNIRPGTYDDIFHLIAVAGTSATNTITLQNESGTVTLTPLNGSGTSTTAAAGSSDAIIRMEGTQYTTIQGLSLVNNTLTTTGLKFEGGIFMGNSQLNGTMVSGGRFNTFRNLTIDMKSTAGVAHAGAVGIRYFTSSSAETDTSKASSYNLIENCTITGFWRAGWKNFGISGTNPDRGNIIRGCTLGDFSVTSGASSDIRALEMDCQANLLIENNTIQNIDASIMTTNNIYGIWLNPAASPTNLNSGTIIIRNNTIKNLENSGTGTTGGFAAGIASNNVANNTDIQVYKNKIYDLYTNGSTTSRATAIGIFASTGTPVTVAVHNNMISDLRAPRSTSGPAVRGIDLQNAAGGATFVVYYNSVYVDDTTPPTVANHQSACMYWANFGTGTLDLRNNIYINLMSTTGTGRAVALYASSNPNLLRLAPTTDYNLYYIGTGSSTRGISTDVTNIYQDLAAHQTAVATGGLGGPRDVNSKSKAVNFLSNQDLHLTGASLGDMDLACLPIATYTTDIDGDTRDGSAPYMGADEASPALPVQISTFTATASHNAVTLRWRTISEQNNYGFEVQRRLGDAGNFLPVPGGFVPGRGTTNEPQDYLFIDNNVGAGAWQYRLKQIDMDGRFYYTEPITVNVVTSVASNTPASFSLSQNYPNPFNPETRIAFTLPEAAGVTLTVYSITGQEIATLVHETRGAGRHEVTWNGTSDFGTKVASGTYLYRIVAKAMNGSGVYTDLKKMIILK